MQQRAFATILLLTRMAAPAQAHDTTPDQIRKGAEIYAVNCSPCHGPRMQGSESAFDLRKYPPEQRDRFLNSVTRGKNQMPPLIRSVRSSSMRYGADRRAVNVRVAQTRAET